jgi:diguanylate cyclase (GGDEF)-like protein
MFEQPKIAVIYRKQPPKIISDENIRGMLWKFDYFREQDLGVGWVIPLKDYLAVFFPLECDCPEFQSHLANMFPSAELVGYRNSVEDACGILPRTGTGLLALQLPMPFYFARHLLENFALMKSQRREMALVRRHADVVQEFFEAFVATVESSSEKTDRKLGINLLVNKLLSNIQAEECVLYLFGEGNGTLQRAYSTGNIKDLEVFEHHANSSIIEKVLQSGKPYRNNHYSFELKVPFSKDSVFIRSILCFPLHFRGEKIGVIELLNKVSGEFTEQDQSLIEMLSHPMAIAIQTLDRFEEAERRTITDDLTKLYNYRYLMQYLEADVKRCLRYKKKVSLLFIDVDGFKQINDTFGHLVGSQALSEMGQVFRGMVRETDVVGRYGGDEFVIVLPETPLNGAMVIAERIRKKVEECEFVAQNLSIRLTVSLGVANCPKHTLTAEGLIKKADAAMYRAKELSKNSIKVAV